MNIVKDNWIKISNLQTVKWNYNFKIKPNKNHKSPPGVGNLLAN